jgi:hypothetical protein
MFGIRGLLHLSYVYLCVVLSGINMGELSCLCQFQLNQDSSKPQYVDLQMRVFRVSKCSLWLLKCDLLNIEALEFQL